MLTSSMSYEQIRDQMLSELVGLNRFAMNHYSGLWKDKKVSLL